MNYSADDWDKFWLESSAESAFVGASGGHAAFSGYWTNFFSQLVPVSDETRCIDIASGSGIVIRCAFGVFGDAMPSYSGLDISDAAISRLTRQFPAVTGVVADAASMPFDSYTFDLVTSQFGVEYAGLKGILEAARLVKVDGNFACILHCRPGPIFTECATSLRVMDRLRQARFFPLARVMFKAGFAAVHGAERRLYERAARKFRPAYRVLEQSVLKYGDGVASGFVLRLRNDIEQMNRDIVHLDPAEVFVWLDRLDGESLSYRVRMKSMTEAAIDRKLLKEIESGLSNSGLRIVESVPLYDQADKVQLAWSLRARRDS